MAVYTHGFAEAEQLFAKAGVEMRTLTDYNEVIRQAVSAGYVSEHDLEMLAQCGARTRASGDASIDHNLAYTSHSYDDTKPTHRLYLQL